MLQRSYSLNVKLLCLFKSLQMALFPLAIITLFWKDHIGMSVTDIMVVQAVLAATVVLAEFPSGYIADRLGYRSTLILSAVLATLGWGIYLFADNYWQVLAGEMLYGISMALVSGTDQSLMFESLTELKKQADYPKWSGRIQAFGQVGEGLAALTAATAYIFHFRGPFALEIVVCAVNILVACALIEPNRSKPVFGKSIQQIRDILKYVFITTPRLRNIMVFTLCLGLSSFVPVWLIQLYAEQAGAGLQTLSLNWALANLVVALGAFASYRFKNRFGLVTSLAFCIFLVVVGYLGLGLNHMTYGFAFYYLITFMRGLNGPILMNEKQLLITSTNRAGMLSLQSLMFRATFIIVGPTVGFFVDSHGMHTVFIALGIVFGCLSVLFLWNLSARR